MELGAITTVLIHLSLDEMAGRMRELGLKYIEVGVGGYFPKDHCDPAELLKDQAALAAFSEILAKNELQISAFCIHGDCLHPDPEISGTYHQEFVDACQLAEKIGVKRFTLVSGLPEATPGDKTSNWVVYPYPGYYMDILQWQWEKRLIPYWKEHGKIAEDHGVQLCFEMHPCNLVYRLEDVLRLREAVGPVVGCNLDPSHLFWQGMDVIDVILKLGDVIYHTHAKDSRLSESNVRLNGVIDGKTFQDLTGRSWLFRTVGYGHDEDFWRSYISTLRQVGYDDVLSIEHEDPLIDPEEGFALTVSFLQRIMVRKPRSKLWYE